MTSFLKFYPCVFVTPRVFGCPVAVVVVMEQAFSYVQDVETFSMMDKASNQVSQVSQAVRQSFSQAVSKSASQ